MQGYALSFCALCTIVWTGAELGAKWYSDPAAWRGSSSHQGASRRVAPLRGEAQGHVVWRRVRTVIGRVSFWGPKSGRFQRTRVRTSTVASSRGPAGNRDLAAFASIFSSLRVTNLGVAMGAVF